MKKVLILFLTSALVAPVLAQSSQPWGAISDGRRNYSLGSSKPECPKLLFPGGSQSDMTNVDADPRSALNAMPELTAQLKEQIADLEKELAEMKADDPGRPALENALKQMRDVVAKAPKAPPPPKALNLEQTLAKLRTDLSRALGSGSLSGLEGSAEARNAAAASRGAYMAFWQGKPQASMGLLLRAAKLEPKNAAHLVNLTALALYYGLNREALVMITAAEKIGGTLEPGVLLANKGHALLRASKYAEAEKVLKAAVAANPNLSEPRLNLAFAMAMQGESRCKEAFEWVSRGWWRNDFSDALKVGTRPLEQKFLTNDAGPIPATVPMVQASFNGKPITAETNFYTAFVAPSYTNMIKQLEPIKKVALISELRENWLIHSLVDVIETADRGVTNNRHNTMAVQEQFEQLESAYRSPGSSGEETACSAAKTNLEQRDQILRTAYQTSYRAAFAAAARFNDKAFRYWAQLKLIQIVVDFGRDLQRLQDTAATDLESCTVKPNLEPIQAGAMPPTPKACDPKAAGASPQIGFALTVSCDQITLSFKPPAWMSRFQVLKKSRSPLVDSHYSLRLTGFSSGGFGMVDHDGVLIDAGGTTSGAGKDFRHLFDSSKAAPVWFVSAERGAGR
jgi:tetratricopeptide (TPR) repeat protein